jgi:hypothetical protein
MALKGVTVNGTDHHFDYAYLENKPFKKGTIRIIAGSWSGSDPYVNSVSVSGLTVNSKVDIQPDADALTRLMADGVKAMWAENEDGTSVTFKALGAKPTQNIEIQYVITEL